MAAPNTFANKSGQIQLSLLDGNFSYVDTELTTLQTNINSIATLDDSSIGGSGILISNTDNVVLRALGNGNDVAQIYMTGGDSINMNSGTGSVNISSGSDVDIFANTTIDLTAVNGINVNGDLAIDGNITATSGIRDLGTSTVKTSSYTLATTDKGKYVHVGTGGSIIIPNSIFSEGDAISIFNNTSGDITITCSISTAYIAGDNTNVSTMTLASRGVCTVLFVSGTLCVVTGNVS